MVFSDVVLFLHEFYISFTILVTFFYLVFTFLFILLKAEFEGVRNITILNSTLGFSTGPLGFSTQPGDSQLARADSQLNLGILNWPVGILNSTWDSQLNLGILIAIQADAALCTCTCFHVWLCTSCNCGIPTGFQ